jgi:hypothetical protein
MNLKQYLAIQRKPEYCGINARQMFKRIPEIAPDKQFFHLAINCRDRQIKTHCFRMARLLRAN